MGKKLYLLFTILIKHSTDTPLYEKGFFILPLPPQFYDPPIYIYIYTGAHTHTHRNREKAGVPLLDWNENISICIRKTHLYHQNTHDVEFTLFFASK